MTQTSDRPVVADPRGQALPTGETVVEALTSSALLHDLADLRLALAAHPFPTHQDDLLAFLVARREPARLASRVALLSRTRTYLDVEDVCDDIRRVGEDLAGPA